MKKLMNRNADKNSWRARVLQYYEKYMLVVGVLGQLLFYTQGVKIFLTKSAGDVSIISFLIGLFSVSSWAFYGILLKNKVLLIANIVAMIGAMFVILGILLYG